MIVRPEPAGGGARGRVPRPEPCLGAAFGEGFGHGEGLGVRITGDGWTGAWSPAGLTLQGATRWLGTGRPKHSNVGQPRSDRLDKLSSPLKR